MDEKQFLYTRFYKGEEENPFDSEEKYWSYKYWFYERDYFVNNPNPNEDDFKEYIFGVINHIADYFYAPFEKHLKNYFSKD